MSIALENDVMGILMNHYMPEEFQLSDFFIGDILKAKGDSHATIRHKKMKTGEGIDEAVLKGIERTKDFVERTRRAPNSSWKRETYHARRPDRNYRKRIHPRKSGARSHLRNFRPEIPVLNGNHHSGFSGLDWILNDTSSENTKPFNVADNLYVEVTSGQFKGTYRLGKIVYGHIVNPETLKQDVELDTPSVVAKFLSHFGNQDGTIFYREGNFYVRYSSRKYKFTLQLEVQEDTAYANPKILQPLNGSAIQAMFEYAYNESGVPKFSRKFKNEEPQSMPKIPYREIRNLRHGRQKRSKYMLVNAPGTNDDESHQVRDPVPNRFRRAESIPVGENEYIKRIITTWSHTPIVKM